MNVKTQQTQSAFHLKGSVLTVSVLQILTFDYKAIEKQLEDLVKKNPNFFQHMPIIIDLQKIYSFDTVVDFTAISKLLRQKNLVPVGVINANSTHLAAALEVGLGILPNVKTTNPPRTAKKIEKTKVISAPVRSGQQIYAKDTDLIILSSVSNGAEILADGHIHVYGTLRGRAIAGAAGDKTARIFCHRLEAELISIAGYYKLQEDLASYDQENNIQVLLEEEQLLITPLHS